MGSRRVDRDRRNLSTSYPFSWSWLVYRVELALELRMYPPTIASPFGRVLALTAISVQIIAVITPYMVGSDKGNLGPRVFFIWGSLCTCCLVYAYFLIPETKGLTLEQVDRMLEETTPRTSSRWVPKTTYAAEMGITEAGELKSEAREDVQAKGESAA